MGAKRRSSYLEPRLTWEQLQARNERAYLLRTFDTFCIGQAGRIAKAVDDMAKRIALGPQLDPTEIDNGTVHYEGRR